MDTYKNNASHGHTRKLQIAGIQQIMQICNEKEYSMSYKMEI